MELRATLPATVKSDRQEIEETESQVGRLLRCPKEQIPIRRRFRLAHDATSLNLKRKPQRQLPNASIHGRATDDAERGSCEIAVRVCKLWMVQRIEKFGTKLKAALLNGAVQLHGL